MGPEGHHALLAGPGHLKGAEISDAHHRSFHPVGIGFGGVVVGSACERAAREIEDFSSVGLGDFAELSAVAVTGQKHNTTDVFVIQSAQDGLTLLRELSHVLVLGIVGQHLSTDGNDFEWGAAGLQCLDQPIQLNLSQHRALLGLVLVIHPEIAVVQKEKVHIMELK